jgi:3-hydroxybutyrate dehydrogenase/3-oxoacyl-[acyl-carrier protein] reductase
MASDLEGSRPVAFVTGASSGTGRAIAVALGDAGYRLVLLGRDGAALQATGEAAGTGFHVALADLRDAAATARALEAGLEWGGGADALVNAAGVTGPLGDMVGDIAVDAFDDTIAVNLRAPFLTLSALLPGMCDRRSGRVVTIGGTHGMRGRPGRAAYVASKWGLRGLHRSAAIESGPFGVTVNMVMPGPIRVPRMEQGWAAEAEAQGVSFGDVLAGYTARMGGAMGRLNTPQDVAGVVLFLLGPAAANITGQEIIVDAGTII